LGNSHPVLYLGLMKLKKDTYENSYKEKYEEKRDKPNVKCM